MGRPYWNEKHVDLANEREVDERLRKHQTGSETYQLFESMAMGVYSLKPGEERELDLSDRYVKDVLSGSPFSIALKVTNLEISSEKMASKKRPEDLLSKLPSWGGLADVAYRELQKMAKEKNRKLPKDERINFVGATRVELVEYLSK